MSSAEHLAQRWREARPAVAGVHLDSAACSRQSLAAIEAAARHARHESEVGGYVAAEAAAPVLDAGRAAVAALTGRSPGDVVFTTGSGNALGLLLGVWPLAATVACLPGEYGPNLAQFAAHGFGAHPLPVDDLGGCGRRGPRAARRPAGDGAPDRGRQPSWCGATRCGGRGDVP